MSIGEKESDIMADTKSIKIRLYLLERIETPGPDEYSKSVVAAASEKSARQIANNDSKSEGYIWTDGHLVTAKEIGDAADDVEGVVLWSKEE